MTYHDAASFHPPPEPGTVGWVRADQYNKRARRESPYHARRFCQAPRHAGSFRPAAFVVVIADHDDGVAIQGMCSDCMTELAASIDADANADAIPFE